MDGDFRIGEWLVSPSVNRISRNGHSTRVEPKAMQVLVHLAEHPGVVSKDKLIASVWPDVFVADDVLPGCISVLRKALHDDARRPRIIETIHKSGYRLLLPAQPVSRNGHETPQSAAVPAAWWKRILANRTLVVMAGVVLTAILVAAFAWAPTQRRYDSVAILPFVDAGNDAATQYLRDGIAEEVVNDLSQVRTLKVMAWTSVSRYRHPQLDVRGVGHDLGVKAVLTGRLVREGNRVVLQTELVDVRNGTQLWGHQYTQDMSDILLLQEQLSRDIASNLRIRLSGEEQDKILRRYNASPAAHELYLKGRFFWSKRTKQGLAQGIEYFQQAIRTDPNYALAYAGLADSYNLLDDWGETRPRDSFPKAKAAADRAIALDDSLAEAHVSLAMVRAAYYWDWVGAEKEYRHAIELNPNYATAHQWYGLFLASLRRFPEAEAEIKRAQQLEPFSPIINMGVAEVYGWQLRYDESIEQYKKVIALDPSFPGAWGNLAAMYEEKHEYDNAINALQQKLNLVGDPDFGRELAHVYSTSGYTAVLREELNRMFQDRAKGKYVEPISFAESYVQLGDQERALPWLQKGYEEHSSSMQYLEVSPGFDPIRSRPEFQYWINILELPSSATVSR